MRPRTKFFLVSILIIISFVVGGIALADDGEMHRRNVSGTPDQITGDASIAAMPFYVPVQAADGSLVGTIEYLSKEATVVDALNYARPLVSVYIDDFPHGAANEGISAPDAVSTGTGFADRDAFAAISLDDGATWRKTNLSRSADLSSFNLKTGEAYPGDAFRLEFAVVENKILAVWLSRYCASGNPAYTMVEEDGVTLVYSDTFGVAGAQGSVDFTALGFPEVGEIPYGCVWAARGILEENTETGIFEVQWRKPERLTSGRRDANVQSVSGAKGAGFVLVWQEDPEGLRPGQGLGPGEGWSGAVVNQKTDMWYSYLGWDDFDLVIEDETNPEPDIENLPKVEVPFTVPIRLTDNDMCKANPTTDTDGNIINPYCYADFDGDNTPEFCATTTSWTNPGGTTLEICTTEEGRVLAGRTGASRTRMSLIPYTKPDATVSAWVVMAYEETKALGEGGGTDLEPVDVGKDVYYHTFDMFEPDMVAAGLQLNQPALDYETGEFFEILTDEFNNEFYDTEIARRFSIIIQPPSKAGPSGTTLIAIFKQGVINQGGPADIMIRRFVLPADFDAAVDNPYAFDNMVCDSWDYTDGSNPNYPNGLCLDAAMNVSSKTIEKCDNGSSGNTCADAFPWDGGESYPKVQTWSQAPENLTDQSWVNPYDVAKGHRGFIDGDFIMMMYAWSPNWKANSIGNDKYNLYVRRSFDGGETWTTTPSSLGGQGTEHIENFLDGTSTTLTYEAGVFEQARNVSQITGSRITVLDPRFTPTAGTITEPVDYTGPFYYPKDGDAEYLDTLRDPSRFFVVYETGDNSLLPEFAAVPMDLYYSRAYAWGDYYDEVDVQVSKTVETVKRWDWLENQQDDLSGEASVATNPAGTFFYAVWNQWNEFEKDIITNSDMIFRRVMYLDDVTSVPSVEILYQSDYAVSLDEVGELVILAAARDNDHVGEGIVSYDWESNLDGWLCDDKDLKMPFSSFTPGWHTLTIIVEDGEGDTARTTARLFVAEQLKTYFFPVIND